jgi:TRAP-type C4-dicarboxylate transport system substrate-binding protein
MMKRTLVAVLVTVFMVLTLTVFPFSAQAAGPIKLKAVTFLPDYVEGVDAFKLFMELVEKKSNGELLIDYLGSSEAMGEFEQGPAVQRGVLDIAWLPSAFYAGLAPGTKSLAYSQLTAAEERKSGAYDYIKELHNKAGLVYLGRGTPCRVPFFYIFLNKEVKTLSDLKGLKIVDGMTDAFLKKLGSIPVEIEFGEVYTAMERGTIDGWTFQFPGISGMGWHEVTKYWIDHPFYMQDIVTIMNLKKFKGLPKNLQAVLMDAQKQVEVDYLETWAQHEANEKQKAMKAGMKPLKFSEEEAKRFFDMAYSAAWEDQFKKHPDIAPKLKKLMSK